MDATKPKNVDYRQFQFPIMILTSLNDPFNAS